MTGYGKLTVTLLDLSQYLVGDGMLKPDRGLTGFWKMIIFSLGGNTDGKKIGT